jgi:hypothetical protein
LVAKGSQYLITHIISKACSSSAHPIQNIKECIQKIRREKINETNICVSDNSSPMSARNFPPSFWNSDYQQQQQHQMASTSHHHHPHHHHAAAAELYSSAAAAALASAAAASSSDPYHPHHHHHVHHPQAGTDPWHYHQPAYRAAVHDFTAYNNMASRFSSGQYGPLLLAPSASAHPPSASVPSSSSAARNHSARHQYLSSGKAAGDWSSRLHELESAAPGGAHPLVDASAHAASSYVTHPYTSMAGNLLSHICLSVCMIVISCASYTKPLICS